MLLQDLMKFFMFLVITMSAFIVGLNNLYWYYEKPIRQLLEIKFHPDSTSNAELAFGTYVYTRPSNLMVTISFVKLYLGGQKIPLFPSISKKLKTNLVALCSSFQATTYERYSFRPIACFLLKLHYLACCLSLHMHICDQVGFHKTQTGGIGFIYLESIRTNNSSL